MCVCEEEWRVCVRVSESTVVVTLRGDVPARLIMWQDNRENWHSQGSCSSC